MDLGENLGHCVLIRCFHARRRDRRQFSVGDGRNNGQALPLHQSICSHGAAGVA